MTLVQLQKPEPIWERYTDTQLIAAAYKMIGQGGSFAGCIGEAYFHADKNNKQILLRGFADIFERYLEA